jgi:hypothetical protein
MGKFFPVLNLPALGPDDLWDDPESAMNHEEQQTVIADDDFLSSSQVTGFITQGWFGPFLLGPVSRIRRGRT